jgi:hypothetical protein
MAHKFSLQLLEAQERIATLEAEVGCSREQVYRTAIDGAYRGAG